MATVLLLVFPVDNVARWREFQVKFYCIINSAPHGKGYQEAVIDLVVGNGWGGGGGKPHLVTILHRLLFLPKCWCSQGSVPSAPVTVFPFVLSGAASNLRADA